MFRRSPSIDRMGTMHWYKKFRLHRDDDLPAVIYADGTCEWFKNGVLHRAGYAPAVIYADGPQWWYRHGKLHREGDLPAVIESDGSQKWWVNGLRHRDGNKPAVITTKTVKYYVNSTLIREEPYDESMHGQFLYHKPGRHTKAAIRRSTD